MYFQGIGFDGVYEPRRFVRGIAEAAACGAPMVVKGTEFVEDGNFTLLTAEQFAPQRKAIEDMHRWLEDHAELYDNRTNLASICLLFPGDELWFNWNRLASRYFGVGQALLAAGFPWKVVSGPEHLESVETLLAFGDLPTRWSLPDGLRVLNVLELSGWELPKSSLLERAGWLRKTIAFVVEELFRAYFHSRLARRILDGVGLSHFFLQSPFFKLPSTNQGRELVKAIGDGSRLRVRSEAPVLIEHWGRETECQIHLVNYASHPQKIKIEFGKFARGRILSPGKEEAKVEGEILSLDLDIYAIILLDGTV